MPLEKVINNIMGIYERFLAHVCVPGCSDEIKFPPIFDGEYPALRYQCPEQFINEYETYTDCFMSPGERVAHDMGMFSRVCLESYKGYIGVAVSILERYKRAPRDTDALLLEAFTGQKRTPNVGNLGAVIDYVSYMLVEKGLHFLACDRDVACLNALKSFIAEYGLMYSGSKMHVRYFSHAYSALSHAKDILCNLNNQKSIQSAEQERHAIEKDAFQQFERTAQFFSLPTEERTTPPQPFLMRLGQ